MDGSVRVISNSVELGVWRIWVLGPVAKSSDWRINTFRKVAKLFYFRGNSDVQAANRPYSRVSPSLWLGSSSIDRQVKPAFAGPTDSGFLLPNGWHLTPVGKHIETSDMVLNIRPLADNRHAIATTNGFNEHRLMLLDLVDQKIVAEEKSLQSWFGLAVDAAESKVWWSGGGAGYLHQFELKNKSWQRVSQPEPDSTKYSPKNSQPCEISCVAKTHSALEFCWMKSGSAFTRCISMPANSLSCLWLAMLNPRYSS